MNPILAHVVFTLMGVGLTLGGILMLIRPELFRGIPPDEAVTRGAIRMGALAMIFFGICALLLVFVYGLKPCGPDDCTNF